MIRNYFLVAIRNFLRHKIFSFINVFGLAIGITISILIALLVKHELSYDDFHKGADRLYRINIRQQMGDREVKVATTPPRLAASLKQEISEVVNAIRVVKGGYKLVYTDSIRYNEDRFYYADSTFFTMFSFPLIKGNPESALNRIDSIDGIVITESTAKRYFGDKDPMGEILHLDNKLSYRISGICEDPPVNSHLQFDFMASTKPLKGFFADSWLVTPFCTYVLLKPESDLEQIQAKLDKLVSDKYRDDLNKHLNATPEELSKRGVVYKLEMIKVGDIHFTNGYVGEFKIHSDLKYVFFLIIIAILILIIASINFMNLSTARSSVRAKEVAMRKVLGAHRIQLIKQFVFESLILVFAAACFSLVFVELMQPLFNIFAERELDLNLGKELNKVPLFLLLIVIVGLVSGSYPAFFLSSFSPVRVLHTKLFQGIRNSKKLRAGLVLVQFVVSIVLIIFTIIIYEQVNFIQTKQLGFERDELLTLRRTKALSKNALAFKREILSLPEIKEATYSSDFPGNNFEIMQYKLIDDKNDNLYGFRSMVVDMDFLKTMGIELKKGNFFDKECIDDAIPIVVNEATAEMLGGRSLIGTEFKNAVILQNWKESKYRVIGVVKNFHFESLKEDINPVMMFELYEKKPDNYLTLKFETSDLSQLILKVKYIWNKHSGNQPFEFVVVNDRLNEYYHDEMRIKKLFALFSVIAIIIASLGLFGLAAFTSEQKTKEIGIRKALGSSQLSIIYILTREFTKWVIWANIIAWPLAYLVVRHWLGSFSYSVGIGLQYFFIAGIIALLIAIITVSFQAYKSANRNPADALMYE